MILTIVTLIFLTSQIVSAKSYGELILSEILSIFDGDTFSV
ncbi:nuclease, partial [Pseudoalteromonas sp. S1610]